MKTFEIVSMEFFLLAGATVFIYHLLAPHAQRNWLLAVSLFFYATWSPSHLAVLVIFTCLNYLLGRGIEKTKSKWLLMTGIAVNAASLLTLKLLTGPYGTGLLEQINASTWTGILLPVGFSFYALQNISYLTDVYRNQISAEKDLVSFALYAAYFPKLLAGPIERAKNFLPQLSRERTVDKTGIEQGLYLILLGLLRKIVIADQLSKLRPLDIFTNPVGYSSLERVVWLLVFAFVLYNDFAGYTSIVRGVSCLMGIQLSPNFRQPLLARSFSDFWTRWHITLSEWLRDYIFFPTRRWLMSRRSANWTTWFIPPMVTMLASGLWHGAYLSLIFWGFLHGFYLIVEQSAQQLKALPKNGTRLKLYSLLVFILVTLAWVPFNTPSLRSAVRFFIGLLPPYSASFNILILPDIILLIFFSFWLDAQEQRYNDPAFPRKWSAFAQAWGTATAIILIYLFASAANDISRFVYQFF